jgi:multicomponent Na+:H+ antiporter subunit G
MNNIQEIAGYIFIILGLGFDIFGCIGLIRLPDVYNRLQATTKCVTFGTCSILFGTFV